jgi:hypothetical protein
MVAVAVRRNADRMPSAPSRHQAPMGRKELLVPDPRDHAEERGYIESILRNIPGFRGYLEKEYRRDSDALAREWLADQLEKGKKALDNWGRELVDAGQIDALPQIDRVRGRTDKVLARIRGAVQGYSGFFDLVQVDEQRLDEVYEHDMDSIKDVRAFNEGVSAAAGSGRSPSDTAADLLGLLDQIEKRLDERGELLSGLENRY